jgi:hypothetical protein
VQLGVDRPDSGDGQDQRDADGVRLGARKAAQSESRAAEENRRQREGHQCVKVPVENRGDGMERGGHGESGEHREALLAVFHRQRHGNHEDHAGKFQSANINRFKNTFERAGVRFEGLNEEMEED